MLVLNYNPGQNILELYNILVQVRFFKSKKKLDIQYSKLGIRVVSRVAEQLKTQQGILGKQELLGKSQIWVDTQPSAPSSLKKFDFGNTSYKTSKNRYQTFLFLACFTEILHFVPNILSGIVARYSEFIIQILELLIFCLGCHHCILPHQEKAFLTIFK